MDPSPTYIEPPETDSAPSPTPTPSEPASQPVNVEATPAVPVAFVSEVPVATDDFNLDYEAGTLAVVLGLGVLWKAYRKLAQKQRR